MAFRYCLDVFAVFLRFYVFFLACCWVVLWSEDAVVRLFLILFQILMHKLA